MLQAIAWTVIGLAALLVLDRSRHVLALVVLAVVIAVLLRAPIEHLDRALPRWAAITVVVIGSIAAVTALVALGTVQLRHEIDVVATAVEERIDRVDPESSVGRFLADGDVADRIDEHLDGLPSQILIGSDDPAEGARLGLEALLVVVLVLYALANGRRLARAAMGGDRPAWWAQHVREGVASGAIQVRRLLVTAAASGLIGLAAAWAFDLPGASVLAIWVGVWAVVPIFGPFLGYAPLVLLASLDGPSRALAVAASAGVVATASWYVDRRDDGGARIGPLGLTIALVIGLRFGWLTGPLVAIFVAAATVATLASAGRRDRPIALRDDGGACGHGAWTALDVRSAARATAIVVVVVASIALTLDLAPVPVWVIVGVTLSIALDPLVDRLARRTPLGRGAAVATVVVGLIALVAATLLFAVPSVAQSVRDLDEQLPRIATDLEQLPVVGDDLADRGVADRIQTTVEDLPERLASDTTPLEGALRSAGDGLIATFWILLITVTALLDGRRARHGLRGLVAPDRRAGFDRVDAVVARVIARYAVGSVVIAAIAGTSAFTIAVVAGVPLAPLVALWVALTNFIPQVGGYLGAVPLVLLGLTTGTTRGLIILVVYLLYMQIENRVIQPLVLSRAVDIPPFVAMVAVLVGSAAAGVVGAVLATPLVAVAVSLRNELGATEGSSSRRPG